MRGQNGMLMKLNKEVLIAGCLFAANTVFFVEALKLLPPFEHGEPGPAFYPLVLSVIMYMASIKIMLTGLKNKTKIVFNLKDFAVIRPLLMAGATGLFILVFETMGYWISTLLYTFAVAFIFEFGRKYTFGRTLTFCAVIAVAITLSGWLFFDLLFDLHLPKGVL